jgi:hypothetical protein
MAKVVLSSEEVLNLKNMLISTDKENQQIAFLAMENCDIKNSLSALYLLVKFGNVAVNDLKKACPKVIKKLIDTAYLKVSEDAYELPSMGSMYHVLIQQKAPVDIMKCFLNFHSDYLLNTMKAWGYPVDKLNINITLKENV